MHGHSGPDRRHCSRVAFSPRPRSSRRTRDPNAPTRLGPGPHAGQAIRTRQPRPTKATPLRASPDQRHERPPCPSAFPARATAAVGTHDHSGRHTRHCSRRNTCNRISRGTAQPRLGPGPHAGQAIRTRQPRPTKTTPPRASPGPRHERPPRPSAFPARATAAVGTHDHSGRHTRHCSRLNTCDRASPATWVPPPCQEPNESRAARQPFRRPDRLPVVCAFEAAHAQNSHSLRAPLCA